MTMLDRIHVTEAGERFGMPRDGKAAETRSAEMAKPVFASPGMIYAAGPDIPGNTSTSATIAVGGSVTGELEVVGDTDWYKITLTAGQSVSISLAGTGAAPVADTFLRIYDSNGQLLASNDDGGSELNSLLRFTAGGGGTYYIEADSYASAETGEYTLSVSVAAPLEIFTIDQIADQLTAGYWGGSSRSFDVGADGIITVNVTALGAPELFLAQQALLLWTDVTGITFNAIAGSAEITFTNHDEGAYSMSTRSGSTIISSTVNVETAWLNYYGASLDSYSFQAYVHEIGHALGLGHAGNYNGDASYANDALFLNDAWSTTIMSYFDQADNTYFSQLGFDYAPITSPMIADIAAMGDLYGRSISTRTGDTTYGFNSTSDRAIHDAAQFSDTAYTIVDSGGNDTLDYSGFGANQLIDLNVETFSNIGGLVGNVSIGRGTMIENARGGSGADTIYGNAAGNFLYGNDGNDIIEGRGLSDVLEGHAGDDRLYGGNGADTIRGADGIDYLEGGSGWDNLFGGQGDDVLIGGDDGDSLFGDAGADSLSGGTGNDLLRGGGGRDTLDGGDGADVIKGDWDADTISGGAGNDQIFGGDGADVVDGGSGNDRIYGQAGFDQISGGSGNDQIFGENGNDTLSGGSQDDSINGGAGDDIIEGGLGNDLLTGGGGSDLFVFKFYGSAEVDTIVDFTHGDKIGLDRSALFGTIEQLGAISTASFVYGRQAKDADDRILYDKTTGELFYDVDGVGGIDPVLFAKVTAGLLLNVNSFHAFNDAMPPPIDGTSEPIMSVDPVFA